MLEPPVANNLLLSRPVLPQHEIMTIRRLSSRVNVLPVIARADVLSNERLAAVKMAVRTDLANHGIGFGIFDENYPPTQSDELTAPMHGDSANGHSDHSNGTNTSATNSPPPSPAAPSLLKLPYALISPDVFCHSDGVPRKHLSRHDLVLQYHQQSPTSKLPRGKFTRNYRWGSLDVLDPVHSDFMPLRTAIFHHMEVSPEPV